MAAHDRDRKAMQSAIKELSRSEPTWAATLTNMLQSQPFEQVGAFAAGVCQVKNLQLKAWECPPCDSFETQSDCYGARPAEIRLLQRMLRAGVSRYHPNPMQALAALEHAA
jgi:hypothetical protein